MLVPVDAGDWVFTFLNMMMEAVRGGREAGEFFGKGALLVFFWRGLGAAWVCRWDVLEA